MRGIRLEELPETSAAAEAWAAARPASGAASPDEPVPPGMRRIVALRGEEPVARAAFGARGGFAGAPGLTGFVGWYDAAEQAAGVEVLRHAVRELFAAGAERVVGPLNGSTWARYRLALPRDEPLPGGEPFLFEPCNPPEHPEHFAAAGLSPLLEYQSRWVPDPRPADDKARARLAEHGIAVRGLELERFDDELQALHGLSVAAFAANPFYTELPLDAFRAQYARLRDALDPALVRLARGPDGALLGYVFAYSDPLAPPGYARVVLKTLATAPAARGLGLGGALVQEIHSAAAARGQGVIHALMQVTNHSTRISARSDSRLFRRYALYGAARP